VEYTWPSRLAFDYDQKILVYLTLSFQKRGHSIPDLWSNNIKASPKLGLYKKKKKKLYTGMRGTVNGKA
jgi:hypothetical protein